MALKTSLFALSLSLFLSGLLGAAERPNVLIIYADDLGYGDLSVQGNTDFTTPNIDSIAQNGVKFTDGYVTAPLCSPSRAGMLSGQYQQRFGAEVNPAHGNAPLAKAANRTGMPAEIVTFAERMKALGYATGLIGKWHLGFSPEQHPMKQGFDEFFGFLSGARGYIDAKASKGRDYIMRGYEQIPKLTYTTDMFGEEASAFVKKHDGKPWFLYLAFNAVHTPMQVKEEDKALFPEIKDVRRRQLASMATRMDKNVGLVLETLRQSGQLDNTLIFFASDNGGPEMVTACPNATNNGPLRGNKSQMLEGGIRVPMFAQWTGHIPAGSVYREPVSTLDWQPTALAAAGGNPQADKALEGVDLLPYVTGTKNGEPHEVLYWRMGSKSAIRQGDWKLCREKEKGGLYNLADDIGEANDLSAAQPEKVKELQAAWDAWNATLPVMGQMKNEDAVAE